jgi:1,4-dihydroxy-2-naphthoate octaprenyltransferase
MGPAVAPLVNSRRPVTVLDVLQIVDIRTKIVSLSSLAIGTAYACATTRTFAPDALVLMVLATLCVDMGTTAFNTYYDFVRGVDTVETDVEQWKALVQRAIAPGVASTVAWLMFALAAICGLAIGALVDWRIVPVGAACMAVGFLYSAGPVPIARLPIGELFAGGLLGSVLIAVAAYVQGATPDARIVLLGLPSTTLIATILSVNNACDIEGDTRAGRRTLAIVLGRARAEWVIALQGLLTMALAFALVPLGVLPAAALVPLGAAALFAWRQFVAMRRRGFSHTTKSATMGSISAVFAVYTLAILAGIDMRALGMR